MISGEKVYCNDEKSINRNMPASGSASFLLERCISRESKDLTGVEHAGDRLLIGTTTSLDATGALDVLSKKFAEENNVSVEWVAVGTGQAIKYGENGDVDLVMVHDRAAEDKFLTQDTDLTAVSLHPITSSLPALNQTRQRSQERAILKHSRQSPRLPRLMTR